MWAWNFFMYSKNMLFRVVFVTCLLALVSANPLENGFETRIVSGRDAKKREFPYQVSMQFSNSNEHICGGAILSEIWVVLAAHCISGDRSKIIIKAGKHNIKTNELSQQQTVEVVRIFVHEKFKPPAKRNDIAMLKLAKPLKLNRYVNIIYLPVQGSQPTGTAILSGWGSISRTTQPLWPEILQTALLELWDAKTCERIYKQIDPSSSSIDPNNLCTAPGNNGPSPCKGDSGSPLVQGNKIVGILSYGAVPCTGHKPTIYTKVSSFANWINDKMRNY